MSISAALSLAMQGAALLVVLTKVRGQWVSHVGALFMIMCVVVHGLTEVVQGLFPSYRVYRSFISAQDLDSWLLIVGPAILIYGLAYAFFLRPSKRMTALSLETPSANVLPPWTLMVVISAIGLVGVSLQYLLTGAAAYWVSGLTEQFLLFAFVLTSLTCVVVSKGRYMEVILILQTLAAFFLASRTAILISTLMLLTLLYRYGFKPKLRTSILLTALLALVIAAVSSARGLVGRVQLQAGAGDRISGLFAGIQNLYGQAGAVAVLSDTVYRFDGNAFPALLTQRFSNGAAPVGVQPLLIDLYLSVPSFLFPAKTSIPEVLRNETAFIIHNMHLPTNVSFLPGTLGVLYGSFGPLGLWVAMFVAGWLFAQTDNQLHQKVTLFGMLFGLALTYAALTVDVGLIWYFIALRAVLVLYGLIRIVLFFQMATSQMAAKYGRLDSFGHEAYRSRHS